MDMRLDKINIIKSTYFDQKKKLAEMVVFESSFIPVLENYNH